MSSEEKFLASLKVPYQLGKDGRIRTIRRLDKPPPSSLIPEAVLRLKRRWDERDVPQDGRQLSDMKKKLRRYWLVPDPQPRPEYSRKAYLKAWRARNPGYGRTLKPPRSVQDSEERGQGVV